MATQKLELTWIGKEKTYEIEPRILIENPNLSYEKVENFTIHNLLTHFGAGIHMNIENLNVYFKVLQGIYNDFAFS